MVVKRRFLADKTSFRCVLRKSKRFFTSSNCSTASRFTGPSARIDRSKSLTCPSDTAKFSRGRAFWLASSKLIWYSSVRLVKRRRKTSVIFSFSASALAWLRINSSFCLRAWSKWLRMSSDWPSKSSNSNFRRISPWFKSVFSWFAVFNWSSRTAMSTIWRLDSFCSIKSSRVDCSLTKAIFSSSKRSKSFFSKRWREVSSVRDSFKSDNLLESLSKRSWTASLFDLTCSISCVTSNLACSISAKRACNFACSPEISNPDNLANSCSCISFRFVSSSTRFAICS